MFESAIERVERSGGVTIDEDDWLPVGDKDGDSSEESEFLFPVISSMFGEAGDATNFCELNLEEAGKFSTGETF